MSVKPEDPHRGTTAPISTSLPTDRPIHLLSPTTLLLAQLAIDMDALADDLALGSMFAALF